MELLALGSIKIGFRDKWIGWIKWCISIVRFSVFVNGTLFDFFQSSSGLSLGDPLLPYLFVIVVESLSCLLKMAVSGGYLSGCQVRNSAKVQIFHLFFADDTLVFCEASQDQITYCLCGLRLYRG